MKKILVILAAGLGTRFGNDIKQLQSVDDNGHIIIDYSIHDAIAAGFNKLVFLIRRDIEADFMAVIGKRIEAVCEPLGVEVTYGFQDMDKYTSNVENERRKPWGTGHAVLCVSEQIDSPFAVINADDYYGKHGFIKAAKFLEKGGYGLVGYVLKNTLSENGGVTRGICSVEKGKLTGIKETKHIKKSDIGAEADGTVVDLESLVSMNFWCFPAEFVKVLEEGFPKFLNCMKDPMQDEYLLPIIADGMLKGGTDFTVLPTDDCWFGITFKEDQKVVEENFRKLIESGVYSADLYSDLR